VCANARVQKRDAGRCAPYGGRPACLAGSSQQEARESQEGRHPLQLGPGTNRPRSPQKVSNLSRGKGFDVDGHAGFSTVREMAAGVALKTVHRPSPPRAGARHAG